MWKIIPSIGAFDLTLSVYILRYMCRTVMKLISVDRTHIVLSHELGWDRTEKPYHGTKFPEVGVFRQNA